jgi:hypothetical protein
MSQSLDRMHRRACYALSVAVHHACFQFPEERLVVKGTCFTNVWQQIDPRQEFKLNREEAERLVASRLLAKV